MDFDMQTILQITTIVVSLAAAGVTATIAATLSVRLARRGRADLKRQFCFELQRQFDAPEMFRCRYVAWKKLDSGEFDNIETVKELFANNNLWTFEVSAVLHFFESLERYCDEGLVDPGLATKLFSRTFEMWDDRLLGRLIVDEQSERYRGWLTRVRGLRVRFASKLLKSKPLDEAYDAG